MGGRGHQPGHAQRRRAPVAVLSGESLPILEDGVINPAIPVGELQSTMCTPWQYDFRDCKCYYWASNRPDVVASDRRKSPSKSSCAGIGQLQRCIRPITRNG